MTKTLVITEKKSVADEFAKVLGGTARKKEGRTFQKHELYYEAEDMIVAWASGHLLELQEPGLYDKSWRFWSLEKLPIIPDEFVHIPRAKDAKSEKLLKHLVKLIRRDDVGTIINGCDAGREGELIFSLILDHAQAGRGKGKAEKPVKRLWLQSMTTNAIRESFKDLRDAEETRPLREAAYSRDQADWLVGMNGTRALTKRFLGGKNRVSLAVGRVKTPTLAFLVDREREIDSFIPIPFYQIAGEFSADREGQRKDAVWEAWWTGKDSEGKTTDRVSTLDEAQAIVDKVKDQIGRAEDTVRTSRDKPPQLFDLTTLQRRASSAFGFTLKRTLSIAQTLYEGKKAITYPRTSSRYLPDDYRGEVPGIMAKLRDTETWGSIVRKVPSPDRPDSERPGAVFDDKKVGDHFALIPTGEIPKSLKPDEQKIYDMIVRRFLAAFMTSAVRETTTRKVDIADETFKATARRLVEFGWRAAEPIAEDDPKFPALDDQQSARCMELDLVEKATSPPSRYTDGTLVGEMETCGKHVENEEEAEALKEIGIGTPATRAAIVEDLIFKRLARREGRTLVPTALGATLVRLVRNLDLGALAKPDLTGTWEQRLEAVTKGEYPAEDFRKEIKDLVAGMVAQVKGAADGSAVFSLDHPKGLVCPKCGKPIIEKAYSYFCSDEEECKTVIHKEIGGKHLFPEILARLIEATKNGQETIGPLTGFERPRAPCKLKLDVANARIVLEPEGDIVVPEHELGIVEDIADGTKMGICPQCGGAVIADGTGYVCEKRESGCKFRLSKTLLFRPLPLVQVRKLLAGPEGETDLIEGFISRRGRPFGAQLYFDEKGGLKWKFPPRPKKATVKKVAAKKKAGAKRKTSRKKTAAKKASPKETPPSD
ncbi:MAG: topoisomerase C-terminal repeat-containing protein [Planctomycetes bacterium]|nr:topoisomerase C-terminal repeat-containing protein [Planctomycetota bacterium]